MADKLNIRKENGHCVVESMKDIGAPATFQKIKSAVMDKMNDNADTKEVSSIIHGVLRKGVNNGFLYREGRTYSTEKPSDAPPTRGRKRPAAKFDGDAGTSTEMSAKKKPAGRSRSQSRKSAAGSKMTPRKPADKSRSQSRKSVAGTKMTPRKSTAKAKRSRSRTRSSSRSRTGASKSRAKKIMKK